MQKRFFGTAFGKDVYEYTIESDSITLSVMDLGATVTALSVPDKNGKAGDIAVGFATAQDYEKYGDNQGATIGRYANRIKHGRFEIDGVQYQIPCNDGENMLHGNNEFRNAKWELCEAGENFLCFSYTSPDGSNGFPGTLKTRVKYSIQNHSLVIDYDDFRMWNEQVDVNAIPISKTGIISSLRLSNGHEKSRHLQMTAENVDQAVNQASAS